MAWIRFFFNTGWTCFMFGKLATAQHHLPRPKEFREDYTTLVEVWEIIHGEIPVRFPSDCSRERPAEVCLSNLNLWVRTWYAYLLPGYFWRQRLQTQEWTAAFVPVCLSLICNILWEEWARGSTRSRASWAGAHMFKPARTSTASRNTDSPKDLCAGASNTPWISHHRR